MRNKYKIAELEEKIKNLERAIFHKTVAETSYTKTSYSEYRRDLYRKIYNTAEWLPEENIKTKTIEAYQWSDSDKCPVCHGQAPHKLPENNKTVGHHNKCPLANTMERAGLAVVFEHILLSTD